jgi:hypothetical protein
MDAARYRYPGAALLGDYARAAVGFLVCLVPLLVTPLSWMSLVLACLAALFAIFGIKTAIRNWTDFAVDGEGIAAQGPFGRAVRWSDIDHFRLAFYATKRDKNSGWMEATLASPQGKLKVDSSLDGFHDIVDQAARAAVANRVVLSSATHANLRAMEIYLPDLTDASLAGGAQR